MFIICSRHRPSREAGIRRIRPCHRKNTGFSGRHYVKNDLIEFGNLHVIAVTEPVLHRRPDTVPIRGFQARNIACGVKHRSHPR